MSTFSIHSKLVLSILLLAGWLVAYSGETENTQQEVQADTISQVVNLTFDEKEAILINCISASENEADLESAVKACLEKQAPGEDFSEFDIYEYYNRMTDEIESEGGELIDELE